MLPITFTATPNSLSLVLDGKLFMLTSDDDNFNIVSQALALSDEEAIRDGLMPERLVSRWSGGKFWLREGKLLDADGEVPEVLYKRVMALVRQNQSPAPLFAFWERLKANPSRRSVTQLFSFLEHVGIPLTEDGCFLAYKSVRMDWKDHHSGSWENTVGKVLSMPRNQISDDPREPCHEGFHVGALSYAATFGSTEKRIVICKVDPADVVCVPYDASFQKMRVCRYEVVGVHDGAVALPDTVVTNDVLPPVEVEEKLEVTSREEEVAAQALPKLPKRRLSDENLMAMSLEELRSYASSELKLVGASKLPGGRWALLSVIFSSY